VRILYHHRTLGDGAEGIHINEMVRAFRDLGHDVRVSGVNAPAGDRPPPGVLGRIRAVLPEAAVELSALAYNLPEWIQLGANAAGFTPDVIYKRHARFDVAPLMWARRRGIPVILEVNAVYSARPYHDFEPLILRGIAERLERRSFELASAVVAVSTPIAQQVRALGAAHAVVIPNAADPERFHPERAEPDRVRIKFGLSGRRVVGWTGILREWHGLDVLLDAVSTLPDSHLLLVGDGPARAAVQERAAELGISDRLTITGRVPHAAVADFVAAMDLAVVAAERTGVASPMKLLEYMSMGAAIVAPRTDSIADVIDDGANGLLFVPGDAQDLSRTLRRLLADEQLRSHLGRRARADVERDRNWRRNAQKALALVPNLG
jgi:glycosyltransferase involved in cell wall biosynthesis